MIRISRFGTVPTVAFYNNSCNPPKLGIWVCEDEDTRRACIKKLEEMNHIQIVDDVNNAIFQRNQNA